MRVLGLLFFLIAFPVLADTKLTTQIYDVDYGKKIDDEILVLLTSGHVAKIHHQNESMLENFRAMKNLDTNWFDITLDEHRFIKSIKISVIQGPEIDRNNFALLNSEDAEYIPTTVASMELAKKYHREGRRNAKDSQCFNRAMVWTYEWWKNHSLKSMKLLIFFTRNYIRRYNFEWWFHIAPYLHVQENNSVVERVMDLKYTSRPMPFAEWTNIFMKNDAPCPVITRFGDYADYPYSGECFIMRTHMYTYQPADLQMYEAWGYKKERFNMEEVKGAYLEAFDIGL